jgi:DNA adenine methylase
VEGVEVVRVKTRQISVRLPESQIELLMREYKTESMTEIVQALVNEKLDDRYRSRDVYRPVFSAIGGKQKLADRIIKFFPVHKIYVEPFGNTAAVLVKKPRSGFELYNDICSEVVNFHEVLRDDAAALIHACEFMPYSEALYTELTKAVGGSKVERAVRYFYLARCGYLGVSNQLHNSYRGKKNTAEAYYRSVDRIPNRIK